MPIAARPRRWRTPVGRAVAVVGLLAVVGFVVRSLPVDAGLARSLDALHVGVLGAVCSAVYTVFEPMPAILLTIVITGIVWVRTRRLHVAAAFAGVVAVTWLPSAALKVVVGRPRPDASVLPHPFVPAQPDASFPSGHVVFLTALLIALLMLVSDRRRRRRAAALGAVVVVAVATALCIDGVHWPADVAASIAWSVAVAPAARWLWVDVVLASVLGRRERSVRQRRGENA